MSFRLAGAKVHAERATPRAAVPVVIESLRSSSWRLLAKCDPRGIRAAKLIEYEEFIETQLRKTRSQVRSVDIAGHLMTLAAGSLVYFLLAALVDHWLVAGGLGFWSRLTLCGIYLVAVGGYLAVEVLPLLVRRINPIYAAHTIERSRPSLKNALVNFLLFRDDRAGINPVVYDAIETQAATNLAQVRIESAVDRTKLVRLGYALVAIFFVLRTVRGAVAEESAVDRGAGGDALGRHRRAHQHADRGTRAGRCTRVSGTTTGRIGPGAGSAGGQVRDARL